ncbi:carbohydrate esterase family 9 protein [Rickenella mellea]|uniref:Carbohydrate esterase family 9 protein n=1 Tax=Rickenella mellea TaxID=50990 RepID=A0A4Y7PWL5_9AGAM|nr:carbohydrate esterase family 9 protein [Rickenella mellea]
MGPQPEEVGKLSMLGISRTAVHARSSSHGRNRRNHFQVLVLVTSLATAIYVWLNIIHPLENASTVPLHASEILDRCRSLNVKPTPHRDFYARTESDRYVPGTLPVLISNATIWTGNHDGRESVRGHVLMARGLIKWVGEDASSLARLSKKYRGALDHIDAKGAWLTPGIVDVHSHLAVEPSPGLNGAADGNSVKAPVQPWLRSLDGLNTHDDAYKLAIAGGVTTSLILPGSADAMGGQAFVIKLRPTAERSPTSMLLEPPYNLNSSKTVSNSPPRWRHMKHACGENPSRVFGQTRMDTFWEFRQAYNKAKKIKDSQDTYCTKARAGQWTGLGDFPDDLQWEALVDILRGKVKVQTHCYEAVDLDDFVRLSNEFQFPIAAFHHAHETYLVPDVLKRAYGDKPPASAMFASFARYKRESYRHSEFAPRILHDNGLKVIMKSDHPAIVSRYLMHESQQAHYYGLPSHVAMSAVISTPAEVMGLDHRIGFIREGYDADVVLWDSHPLAIGATPTQVYIDGIPQLKSPYHIHKPKSFQVPPNTPDWDKETKETLEYDGLPPLEPKRLLKNTVVFTNVSNVWQRADHGIATMYTALTGQNGVAVVDSGRVVCTGAQESCLGHFKSKADVTFVDLDGGSISPGLVSFGTNLGLQEIAMEHSTIDGAVTDALTEKVPKIVGGDNAVIRAVDGLQFSTRDSLLAYRAGVTSAITAPLTHGFFSGLSVYFSTGASHKLASGAIVQDIAALHVSLGYSIHASTSTQVGTLRKMLLEPGTGDMGYWFEQVVEGELPLVIDVHSADIIATLLALKEEVENRTGRRIIMTLSGATEAHLLAKEIGEAKVGVIVNPVRPFPYTWERRRILPGPPLSPKSAIAHLLSHNVTVGVGVMGVSGSTEISTWSVRNTRFDIAWAIIEAGGSISTNQALGLASANVEMLLGVKRDVAMESDLVASKGGNLLDFESKVLGIISPRRSQVELL